MASSQVEIATSSSPFGRDSCNFHHNTHNKLVNSYCMPNDKSRHIDFTDLWVHRPPWQTTTTANNECDHKPDKWARARQMVFSVDHGSSAKAQSESSLEVSNLGGGVSSLVQKWRGFEAKRSNSRSPTMTNTMFQQDNTTAGADPPTPSPSLDDYSFVGDWESADRTGPPSSEIERLRVADIIRKLTDNREAQGCDSPPPPPPRVIRTPTSSDQSEQRCVVNSPRIRGRQAFNDLLMQMERDRHKEIQGLVARKSVSKFSHRGRIQALLQFRFLHRGMEAKEGCHSNGSKSSQMQKAIQNPVMHIRAGPGFSNAQGKIRNYPLGQGQLWRERVNPSAQKGSVPSGCCHKELIDNSTFYSTGINSGEKTELPHSIETSVHNKEREATNHQVTESNYDHQTGDFEEPPSNYHKEEPASNQHLVDTSMYWVSDVSNPDLQYDNQHQEGSNREWIDEVSRPRSDWEDLRQARYQEMLDPFLDNNDEIRMLLGRRSVSTFLSSGLREQIDRVMISRVQGTKTLKNDQTQEEKHERRSVSTFLSSGLREQIDRVMISRVQGTKTLKNDQTQEEKHERLPEQVVVLDKQEEGEDYSDNDDEYEEAGSSVRQQYNESGDYTDRITSSSPESWPHNQVRESSDYSYQVVSPSTQQSSSNYYSHDSRPKSSDSAHPTIDMELIYDLRGHMEQIHQDMFELRKLIKCCMDMQIKLQRSIKKEVSTALHHSEAKNGGRNAVKKVTTGGTCCVCCKMQVDSVLYRCGHMCTCFKCAHKLHWSSGKCPICRAPILDVVRTYSNHS